ncbi:MAG: nitrous oxide reductase accessory protein NosL [Nitrospirae bacterium]|nr:MAG: nitrous oxide reductase accessory protein NosL [Nitrospirota bacterium]
MTSRISIRTVLHFFIPAVICCFTVFSAHAAELKTVKPTQKDKCPVCGMFVAKYPDFTAGIVFKDGSHAVFDGVKDMFKYYFNMKKYNPSKKAEDIGSVFVTEYYGLGPVDARKAFFVFGSDVHGPMGRELIPFEKMSDATGFMKDHRGKRILKFSEITPDIIRKLD